ncbi:MAG: hypothetical protein QOF51_1668 [Chloroflexota bacterium]|nr:hypothetical protein [Chloroflexota bacterium]
METGKIHRLPLAKLRLDPLNPRLPEDVQGGDQQDLAEYISQAYEPLSVATSIAEHGFFESEPLIAVPDGDEFMVVEGNRRLTALLGLTDDALRAHLESPSLWAEAAKDAAAKGNLPADVPVLVVADRRTVAPIIGFRHISGIMQWEPFAKARFIAALVDDEGLPFADVAALVGEKRGDVASNYRNYSILKQAREAHDLDVDRVEESFGVFTAAMGQRALRTFIGAPDPGQVQPGDEPVPEDKSDELGELLTWIFGDEDGQGRVIGESRDLGLLARVVSNQSGLTSLRSQGDLKTAADATTEGSGDVARKAINKLLAARTQLRAAAELMTELEETDDELDALIEDCEGALNDIKAAAAT